MKPTPRRLLQCLAISTCALLLHAQPCSGAASGQDTVPEAQHPSSDAQEPPAAVTLQFDLITPFFTTYYLETNVRVSDHIGLLLNTSYLRLTNGDWKTETATLGAGLSYYLEGEALRGWYVEAVGEVNLSSWRHSPSGKLAPWVVGETGVAVGGYRFICEAGPVLDVAAGVVVLHLPSARVVTDGVPTFSESLTRVYPAVKLNVGWAF